MDAGVIVAVIAVVMVVVINVGGWMITANRINKAAEKALNATVTKDSDKLAILVALVEKLPCIKDSDYAKEQGALNERVKLLKERLDKMEAK